MWSYVIYILNVISVNLSSFLHATFVLFSLKFNSQIGVGSLLPPLCTFKNVPLLFVLEVHRIIQLI